MTQPDLFPDAIQPSPYLQFIERHGIVISHWPEDPIYDPYIAWYGFEDLTEALSDWPDSAFGGGATEKEAVKDLAAKHNLDGWEGVNWE